MFGQASRAEIDNLFPIKLSQPLTVEHGDDKVGNLLTKTRLANRSCAPQDVTRLIARLGRLLGRKDDGQPGVKTIRLGLQRVINVVAGRK